MMNEYIIAYGRPVVIFMSKFCRNSATRYSIPSYYRVSVDVYEEYAPGQRVFAWYKNGVLIGGAGMMFRVEDRYNKLLYYPIFPVPMAKELLKQWHMSIPPKWSVYGAANQAKGQSVDPINQQMRNLLAYARLFVSMQQRFSTPMPYGFKEAYEQLHAYPDQAVDGSVVALINRVLSQYLCMESTVTNCKYLLEFITYLHNRYQMLEFVDSDFSMLRQLLQEEEPGMKCYF